MHLNTKIAILITSLCITSAFSQINKNRKKTVINRVNIPPKIDGDLSEKAWKKAEILKDFVMLRPDNGKPEQNDYRSEVKLCYDDNAIYIGAMFFDPEPSKIPMEFATRDDFGNTDFIGVNINPNDDGQNSFLFFVQATGNQADAKVSGSNEDFGWSAVWTSQVKTLKTGWAVEIKIPYRALRFSNDKKQSWGINIHRNIRNLNAQYTWNYIDNSKGNITQYDGLITGITDIQPPTRLTFYPYASASFLSVKGEKNRFNKNIGMDIKYGLSENFTLDATLIPDFSQVGFDNVQLNLGPFEQQFSEQRAFFTEGIELFNKGNLFYSRRIGGTPVRRNKIETSQNEEIIENQKKTQLLNAIKVSGRTKKGWGIGFFNAITDRSKATIQNKETKEIRKVTTQSLTNYNVFVVDKQFNGNSSIALTNTNVLRQGNFKDANATALSYHVETKDSRYFVDGGINMTYINADNLIGKTGYSFDNSIGKNFGKWRGKIGYSFKDKNYNPNDLGFLGNNNNRTIYGDISYQILKPKGIFNNLSYKFWANSAFLDHSGIYTGSRLGIETWFSTRSRFSFGGKLNYKTQQKDYFEAQQESTKGIFFIREPGASIVAWISSDYRKRFAVDYRVLFFKSFNIDKLGYSINFSPRYRFSNQFSMIYNFRYFKRKDDRGFATTNDDDEFIFGIRDRSDYVNTLSGKFNFNVKSAISLGFRHNWSKAVYKEFYTLNNDGRLSPSSYNENQNVNFNNWNIDINYQWQFAPGSQLVALYRNSILESNTNTTVNFSENLNTLFEQPMQHLFSLKLVYFIDYNNVKNIFRPKKV